MKNKNRWINILILNFCVVAFLGFLLRSKILFSIPFLNYNRLLDAHFHFAFGAWATLAIAVLFIYDILPPASATRPIYKWLPVGILASSWLMLIASPLPANSPISNVCSVVFILVTYVFAIVMRADIMKAPISKTVKLLAVSSLVCLILSSFGIFTLAYLFATKSLSAFAYRDSLYTYLHFEYNGFFTLGIFAILMHKLDSNLVFTHADHLYISVIISHLSLARPKRHLPRHSDLWQHHTVCVLGTVHQVCSIDT